MDQQLAYPTGTYATEEEKGLLLGALSAVLHSAQSMKYFPSRRQAIEYRTASAYRQQSYSDLTQQIAAAHGLPQISSNRYVYSVFSNEFFSLQPIGLTVEPEESEE